MIKKILSVAAILTAVLLVFCFVSSHADATRPVPGYHYKDVCKNISGKQTILDVTGISAAYRFDESTPRKNDCVPVIRVHH